MLSWLQWLERERQGVRTSSGPEQSSLLTEGELGKPEGRTPLPLCTACHSNGVKPICVKRADQASVELGRKEKKQEAKKASATEKAAPKEGRAKGARGKAAAKAVTAPAKQVGVHSAGMNTAVYRH